MARPFPEVEGVEHRYVDAGGLTMHVAEAGPPDGDPILLLHGWPQHWYLWRDVIPPLSERYRVIAPDMLGYGYSAKPKNGEYTIAGQAKLLTRLLDALGIPRAIFIGCSYGGAVAATCALDYPDRVEKLILVGAVILSGRIARPVRELAEGARRVAAGDLDAEVPVATGDEIGLLAGSFNAMTADLRHSRERLLQAERVAAWREMARRLAHELKNPIFPIQLSIETLRRALDQDGAQDAARFQSLFRESSDTILDELRSLRAIVEEFSQFARMPPPRLAPTDLGELVERVLALYRARAATVKIETSLAPGLPTVPADRDLLARALGNLVANALEAMPDGGTLAVKTRAAEEGVALEVSDTGPGLTEEQRTRLFTPYYTTKKGGTGLGLAIVQGIVSDHGGRIQVQSTPGAGTTFTLVLPISIMAEATT